MHLLLNGFAALFNAFFCIYAFRAARRIYDKTGEVHIDLCLLSLLNLLLAALNTFIISTRLFQ